jgi:hypothetical protein
MDKNKIYFHFADCYHTYGIHMIYDKNHEDITKNLKQYFFSHTLYNTSTMKDKENNPGGMFLQSDGSDYIYIEFLKYYGKEFEIKALEFAEKICNEIGEELYI